MEQPWLLSRPTPTAPTSPTPPHSTGCAVDLAATSHMQDTLLAPKEHLPQGNYVMQRMCTPEMSQYSGPPCCG